MSGNIKITTKLIIERFINQKRGIIMRTSKLTISLIAIVVCGVAATAATLTLQQGVNGYSGTFDKYFVTNNGNYGGAPGPGELLPVPVSSTTDKTLYVIENG